ncbi:MAG: hypothetical protein GYA16_06215 [Spirochaetes bacterium]|nr:hypothetical protein [Spirochaetota bacterium]
MKAIQHVFDVCKNNNGEITNISSIAEKYGVAKNFFGMALQRKGFISKTNNKSFILKTSLAPSIDMADSVINEMQKISKEVNSKFLAKKKGELKEEPRKLVSIAEIENKSRLEARKLLIQASRSASILGVQLMDYSDDVIEKYLESITKGI